MGEERYEILDILERESEITADIYENLITIYDKQLVDKIIESQIDAESLDKYDYYVNYKLYEFNDRFNDSYSMYLGDINNCKKFNSIENKKHFKILYTIINELDEIFSLCGYKENMNGLSVLEKVNLFLEKNRDVQMAKKVKKIYNKYVNVRNNIIVGNLSLVVTVANFYMKNNFDDLDIIQNGNEGLMIAIDKYNIDKDTTFATYACFWIKNNIIKGLRNLDTLVSVPQYLYNTNKFMIKTINKLTRELGRVPSDAEIAEDMKITIDKLRNLKITFENIISFTELEEIEGNSLDEEILIDRKSDLLDLYTEKEEIREIFDICKKYLSKEECFVLERIYASNNVEKNIY